METTITKKQVNLPQIFAGILFMIFAASGIIEKLITIINFFSPSNIAFKYYDTKTILFTLVPNIIMIIIYIAILVMSIFVLIGKPRIMTPVMLGFTSVIFLIIGILSLLSSIGSIQIIIDYVRYGLDSIAKTLHTIIFIRNLVFSFAGLVMFASFVLAAVLTLIGFIKKSKTPLWPIPGIIAVIGTLLALVYEILYAFHGPITKLILSLNDHGFIIGQSNNFLGGVFAIIVAIIAIFGYLSACIGLFLVCKASKND